MGENELLMSDKVVQELMGEQEFIYFQLKLINFIYKRNNLLSHKVPVEH